MAVVLQKSLRHAAGSGVAHIGDKRSAQFSKKPSTSHPRVELTAVTRCRMIMDEDMLADETDAYTMGFLIMQALTDPAVKATHCNL